MRFTKSDMDNLCEVILIIRYRLHRHLGYKIHDLKLQIANGMICAGMVTHKQFMKAWDYLTQEGLI